MDCSPPGSSIHGIFQARVLEWIAIAFSTFRHNLNQIPYACTVEVTNRFKGLYLVDRVPEKLWTEVHNIVQEAVTKIMEKRMQEGKVVV